jgi:hypothetical protein
MVCAVAHISRYANEGGTSWYRAKLPTTEFDLAARKQDEMAQRLFVLCYFTLQAVWESLHSHKTEYRFVWYHTD